MRRKTPRVSVGEMLLRLGIETDHPGLRPTAEERARVLHSTALRRSLLAGLCIPPRSRTVGQRMAFVLEWAARHYPHKFIDGGDMAAVLLGVSRGISSRSMVRAVIASAAPGARAILQRKDKFIVTVRGVGLRATTDKRDIKDNVLPRFVAPTGSTLRASLAAIDRIDAAKLAAAERREYATTIRVAEKLLAQLEGWGFPRPQDRATICRLRARMNGVPGDEPEGRSSRT